MIRLCGASLGLFAFSLTIMLGLAAGNPAETILLRSVQAMLIFCGIGLCVGWVASRVLDEHALRRHREMFSGETGSDASGDIPVLHEAVPTASQDQTVDAGRGAGLK
jgi:hypothetical protein